MFALTEEIHLCSWKNTGAPKIVINHLQSLFRHRSIHTGPNPSGDPVPFINRIVIEKIVTELISYVEQGDYMMMGSEAHPRLMYVQYCTLHRFLGNICCRDNVAIYKTEKG